MVDVETLQRENVQLREQLARVIESNQTLTEQIAKLNDRVTELLAVAQRRQRKPATEKAPPAPPELTEKDKQSFDGRPKTEAAAKARRARTLEYTSEADWTQTCPFTSRVRGAHAAHGDLRALRQHRPRRCRRRRR